MTQLITDEEINNFWERFNPINKKKFKEIILQIEKLVFSQKDAEIKELKETERKAELLIIQQANEISELKAKLEEKVFEIKMLKDLEIKRRAIN